VRAILHALENILAECCREPREPEGIPQSSMGRVNKKFRRL
jgi:hypothetical protein